MKTNKTAWHMQLVRLVNSFYSELEEAQENLEIEILCVLRRLGADESSKDDVIAASDGTALESNLPRAAKMSRS